MNRRRSFFGLPGLWLVLLPAPALRGDEPPQAVWSAEQLRGGLLQAQRRVRSVYVAYRADKPAGDPRYPPGSYVYRIVAAKAPGFLYHVNAHGHERLRWQDDPLQQRCYVTADHWYVENPVNRTYSEGPLRPDDRLPGSMPGEFFFTATGLWPTDQRPPPHLEGGEPYMLHEVAQCDRYTVVRPRQELADGRWCHVLERPGLDCLWIDAERGFALLARETCSVKNQALMQRIELGGHREVAPGVWLPGWMRNIQYDYRAGPEERRTHRVKDARMQVLAIKVNEVADSQFEYQPPPGALRLSPAAPPVQTHPGGLDHLDHLVRWSQEYLVSRPAEPRVSLGYLAALPALFLILSCEGWSWWRRRRPSN